MGQGVTQYAGRDRSYPVTTASPTYIDMLPFGIPSTVTAVPGASGSLAIATSTTPGAAGNPGAATWVNWTPGTVSAATTQTLTSPVTALRATATTAAGAVEIVG